MSDHAFTSSHILRGAAVTAALTMVSRVLGFFRDLIVALAFGAGIYADCYFVAFRIPNMLRSFVAEGALSAAFVPVFSNAVVQNREEARRVFSVILGFLLTITIVISVLGIWYSSEIVRVFAPGFDAEQRALATTLTQIMFPYVIFVSVVALLSAALNSLKIFGAAASAQSIMNLVLIAGGIAASLYEPRAGVMILAVSVIAGGAAQVIFQIPALHRSGLSLRPTFKLRSPAVRQLLKLMGPALIGATVYQISIFISTLLASLLEPGSVSWLFYADRLVQLPIGIYSIALASVLLPALSVARASNDEISFQAGLGNSLRFTSYLILPVATLLFCIAEPLITVLFERGAFDRRATLATAAAVQAMSFGIWAVSCHSMMVRACMARKDNVTPTVVGLITLGATTAASLVLMGPPRADAGGAFAALLTSAQSSLGSIVPLMSFGHAGLALSSSFGALLSLTLLSGFLAVRYPQLSIAAFLRATGGALLGSIIGAAAVMVLPIQQLHPAVQLLLGSAVGTAVYLAVTAAIGMREPRELWAIARRRLKR